MRYLDWDVLLFEGNSRTPIQEFKTQCCAILDPETQLQTSGYNGLPSPLEHVVPLQVPSVTCFIASIPTSNPFRVSIYSWNQPQPSPSLESIMAPDDLVLVEARLLLDGNVVSAALYELKGKWPQIIGELPSKLKFDLSVTDPKYLDFTSERDKNGSSCLLKFPPFHQEILQQNWWNVAENLGRIKLILAEGIVRQNHGSGFERIKNVVVFSFQHAPLEILEQASIAYPNSAMWNQARFPVYSAQALSPRKARSTRHDEDTHSHSPHRPSIPPKQEHGIAAVPFSLQTNTMPPPPLPTSGRGLSSIHNTRVDAIGTMPSWHDFDPFFDHNSPTRRQGQSSAALSLSDINMPDYSRSVTPGSSVSAAGQHVGIRTGDASSEQVNSTFGLSEARRDTNSGTFAPTNTRRSSVASAISAAPVVTKPSAAAEARTASYASRDNRRVSAMEFQASMKQHHRESSMTSANVPSGPSTRKENSNPTVVIHSDGVKSKKEGKPAKELSEVSGSREPLRQTSNESGPKISKTGSKSNLKIDSGSKRKRVASSEDALESTSANSSPSLRASKGAQSGSNVSIMSVDTTPLQKTAT